MQFPCRPGVGRCAQEESVGPPVIVGGRAGVGPSTGTGSPTARTPVVMHRRGTLGANYVSARFLPYDDVYCRVALDRSRTTAEDSGNEWRAKHGDKGLLLNGRRMCRHSDDAAMILPLHSRLLAPSTFLSELQDALACTAAVDNADASAQNGDGDGAENVSWSCLFRKWPLELAASGYAEWWLRHPRCTAEASQLFRMLIDGVALEECRRKPLIESTGGREQPSDYLHGVLGMLHAIYVAPPTSLKAAFRTPLYHQQLFFRICRRGANRHGGMTNGRVDGRGLALCLSLAAVVAQRIYGNKLAMRHDLIRFIGRVQRDWRVLLETRSEEEILQVELDRVQSLLAFALD